MKSPTLLMKCTHLMKPVSHLARYLLMAIFYIVRPLLGPSQCRFSLSCGNYAMKQLKEQSFIPAIVAICKRLCLCTPWGPIEHDS